MNKKRKLKAPKPNIKEYEKATDIDKSRGGNICLYKEKNRVYTDGTMVFDKRYIYKRPTKRNVEFVKKVGYDVILKQEGAKR